MHIHHILFDMGAGFASDDWTARGTTPGPVATNPAPATGNPATMTTPGQQHVFYRGVGGSIEHLFYDGATPTVIHYDSWTRMAPRAAAAANDPAISTMTTGQ